jgi:hypothetical protein
MFVGQVPALALRFSFLKIDLCAIPFPNFQEVCSPYGP